MTVTTDQDPLTRRNFLKLGLGALGTLITLELGAASLLFLEPRSHTGEFGGTVVAGTADSFPLGSVTEFPNGRFFLVRAADGGFLAVYRRCTHLGCAVEWEANENHFFCPCHASSFDFYGNVETPPAPRALDTFPVQVKEGQILVDTGEGRARDGFTDEQLVYA